MSSYTARKGNRTIAANYDDCCLRYAKIDQEYFDELEDGLIDEFDSFGFDKESKWKLQNNLMKTYARISVDNNSCNDIDNSHLEYQKNENMNRSGLLKRRQDLEKKRMVIDV